MANCSQMDETEGRTFDVEAAIRAFVVDPSCTTLELPRLSTGQRRQARKLAEEHPEVSCESFGFAADRRLHLFKRVASPAGASTTSTPTAAVLQEASFKLGEKPAVSIKNTFIDGWVAEEVGDTVPAAVTRSMPAALPGGLLQHCLEAAECSASSLDLSPIKEALVRQSTVSTCEASSHEESAPDLTPRMRAGAPTSFTSASSDQSGSPEPAPPAPSLKPQNVQVRNTFIHYSEDLQAREDGRTVQSMPHGRFGELLGEELLARAAAAPGSQAPAAHYVQAPSAPPAVNVEVPLLPGMAVRIEGLVKAPAFNGLCGTVQSLDVDSGRYNVLLAKEGKSQKAQVKGENLRPMTPQKSRRPPAPLDDLYGFQANLPSYPSTPLADHAPLWREDFHVVVSGAGA